MGLFYIFLFFELSKSRISGQRTSANQVEFLLNSLSDNELIAVMQLKIEFPLGLLYNYIRFKICTMKTFFLNTDGANIMIPLLPRDFNHH